MIDRMGRLARQIESFVENPVTNLVKGLILFMIGISDASHTFRDDITHGHIRLGHGLMIIGFFAILGSLPHLLDGLEAGAQYVEQRRKKDALRKREGGP